MAASGRATSSDEAGVAIPSLNVILITLDTTRADALGVYGQALPTTPNIDRVARGGVIFRNAVSATPTTLPSHASIMTGTYPFVHGARTNEGYVVSDENVMLAEILKQHGYRTAAEIDATVLNRRTGMNQGFDSYRDLDSPGIERMSRFIEQDGKREPILMQERYAYDITRSGIKFLESARDERFFLWLHYFAPHAPYVPPMEIRAQIPNDPYLGEVRLVDRELGILFDALDEMDLMRNTLIVITADHGESRGEHGEQTHSLFVYASTIHVPLILFGPGIVPKGVEVGSVVRIVDIAPTILDLLGLPAMVNVQGVSLEPLLEDPSVDLGLMAYSESSVAKEIFGSSVLRSLQIGTWKYIHKRKPELYDLSTDPSERENLAGVQSERFADFQAKLRDVILDAPVPIRSERVELSPLERQQLAMLGYLTGGRTVTSNDEMAEFTPHGPDPTDLIDDAQLYANSQDYWSSQKYDKAFEIDTDLVARYPNSQTFAEAYLLACVKLEEYAQADQMVSRILKREDLQTFWPEFSSWLVSLLDVKDAQAIPLLERLRADEPCELRVESKLAASYHLHRQYAKERSLLEEGVERCEPDVARINNLANLLATCPISEVRDGKHAVELAQKAVKMTQSTKPTVLDTLAAAYAEAGDFENAVTTSRKALSLLDTANAPEARRETFQSHLNLLLQKKPIREGTAAPADSIRGDGAS